MIDGKKNLATLATVPVTITACDSSALLLTTVSGYVTNGFNTHTAGVTHSSPTKGKQRKCLIISFCHEGSAHPYKIITIHEPK